MAKNRGGRGPLGEILFWVILLGADALAMYMIHRSFGQSYNYMDTMPIMLPVGAFVPLLGAVLRYFPKKKGPRVIGIVVALALGVGIGQVALRGFYGEHPFIIEAIYGRNMEALPPAEEIEGITAVLYANGAPDSTEIAVVPSSVHTISVMDFRGVRGGVPETSEWLTLRVDCKDGRTRELRLLDTDKWDFIEEPGVGVWRKPRANYSEEYRWWRDVCVTEEFSALFSEPLLAGEPPRLSEDYNGGEKAAWIDWSQEGYNDELAMKPSWSAAYRSIDHDTPEGYLPERARDVRWLFVKERTDHVYRGYWYEVGTGKKVSDSYDDTYGVTVYDLLTGESRSLTDELDGEADIGDCMKAFFGIAEE